MYLLFHVVYFGASDVLMSDFQMSVEDYPHCTLGNDGFLQTTGRHHPGFPQELWCALIRLGYDRPAPTYRCHLFHAHGLNACKVRLEIPFDTTAPFRGAIISSDLDDGVEKMTHLALTAFCECHLTDTTDSLLALLTIWNQEEPLWQQCDNIVCDITNQ
jgi:hypothetical protein